MAKLGRPTKYTEQLVDEICEAIACSELGLEHLCAQNPHWPARANIFKWKAKYPEFRHKYRTAKEQQAHVCFEFMQELMNEPHVIFDKELGQNRVDVPLLRLKLDHFKWHIAKLQPRDFGDSKQIEPANPELDEDTKKRYRELDERNRKDY